MSNIKSSQPDNRTHLLAICEAASPAPWIHSRTRHIVDVGRLEADGHVYSYYEMGLVYANEGCDPTHAVLDDDMAFISAAREAMPELLKREKHLISVLADIKGYLNSRRNASDELAAEEFVQIVLRIIDRELSYA